ncbi:unnamed protein product [Linum tenue]|uniref:3'-5' exonuclease domain-containing protein n=1 Tax=Linum tenue TaxID=586396 RepID=A0AAV0HLZ3_9ROSI|nr:unnamed protein product [Linum tenue]
MSDGHTLATEVDMFKVGDMVVGIDIEWGFKSTSSSRSASLSGRTIPLDSQAHQQQQPPPSAPQQHAALVTLCTKLGCVLIRMNPKQLPSLSPSLRKFLAIKEILFVGVHIREDLHRMKKLYGVIVRNAVELSDLAAKMNDHPRFLGMSARELCSKVCSIKLEQKPFVVLWSNWFDTTLSNEQLESATTDAYAAYKTGRKMLEGGNSSVKRLFY